MSRAGIPFTPELLEHVFSLLQDVCREHKAYPVLVLTGLRTRNEAWARQDLCRRLRETVVYRDRFTREPGDILLAATRKIEVRVLKDGELPGKGWKPLSWTLIAALVGLDHTGALGAARQSNARAAKLRREAEMVNKANE